MTEDMAQDLALAPRDGTIVWLLVDYSQATFPNPLADALHAWTIGFNNFENDGEDLWRFAGWSWSQDCFTDGCGHPKAWKPLGFGLSADDTWTDMLGIRPDDDAGISTGAGWLAIILGSLLSIVLGGVAATIRSHVP